jgi:hypothetical protein
LDVAKGEVLAGIESDRVGSPRPAQFIFVSSGELPRVVDIIGKMHHFDFVAFIQGLPKLVFAE